MKYGRLSSKERLELLEKGTVLLNENKCKFIGHPVGENEKPVGQLYDTYLYNRSKRVNVITSNHPDYQDYFVRDIGIPGSHKLSFDTYLFENNFLIPVCHIKDVEKHVNMPVIFEDQCDDKFWSKKEIERLGCEIKKDAPDILCLHRYTGYSEYRYDCRPFLDAIQKPFITFSEYEQIKNFRCFSSYEAINFPKSWGIVSKLDDGDVIGYTRSGDKVYRISDEKAKNTPLDHILREDQLNAQFKVISLNDFEEFKHNINNMRKSITSAALVGVTGDYKAVFDVANVYKEEGINFLFDFIENSFAVRQKLGNFLSHSAIVKFDAFSLDDKVLRSPEEINKLDRYQLAEEFLIRTYPERVLNTFNWRNLVYDTALYLDEKIPKSYIKTESKLKNKKPSYSKKTVQDYGFVYYFNKNKNNTSKNQQNSDSIERDKNFKLLTQHLRKKDEFIENDLFKAILFAMNGMTVYMETKQEAIELSSDKHQVPQKKIKRYINDIGIKSTRQKSKQKEYGQSRAMEANTLKKKLDEKYND